MDYKLDIGGRNLVIGTRIEAEGSTTVSGKQRLSGEWDLAPGVYRARELASQIGKLLDAVCAQLGSATAAGVLLNNLQASLSTTAREAVLPAGSLDADEDSRAWAERAERIGAELAQWARQSRMLSAAAQPGSAEPLALRSRCEQHLWTPATVGLLMGPSGNPAVMQLYNEYLHQFVLLRDLLLPYENWQEVAIPVGSQRNTRGLRYVTEARERFLTSLLVKRLPHLELVRFAQESLQPGAGETGYGFQYEGGLVLPAALGRTPAAPATPLLRWYPAVLTRLGSAETSAVVFDYAYEDYEAAPRSWLEEAELLEERSSSLEESLNHVDEAVIAAQLPVEGGRTTLTYMIKDGSGDIYAVDVGQMLRGYRYLYRPTEAPPSAEQATSEALDEQAGHSPASLLRLPGLADSPDGGVHRIDTQGNPLILWALLGKLHPANLVLLPGDTPAAVEAAQHAGKSFGAKYLLSPV
ncbi:hypothetical protein PA598K_06545 [Paenibacillus sp. 598K]|uniref:hypothetical protein n=1 Tax=Paenibacillus sp. 598K TaxID=1117987 RepID=UPI000FFA314D|nr:hypothetical protein [Paenibacillus sp. 598K]GBF77958.1 hypothetical protein PA598K_06545 [Paenibacillus sp. 598K]